jgi:hypothetical protein
MTPRLLRDAVFSCPVHGRLSPHARPSAITDALGVVAGSKAYHLNSRIMDDSHYCRICHAQGVTSRLTVQHRNEACGKSFGDNTGKAP